MKKISLFGLLLVSANICASGATGFQVDGFANEEHKKAHELLNEYKRKNRELNEQILQHEDTISHLTIKTDKLNTAIAILQDKLIKEEAKKQPWFGTKAVLAGSFVIGAGCFLAILTRR